MAQKPKAKQADRQKFQTEIEDWKKRGREHGVNDLELIDLIPNFTGKDEKIPFPYGSGRGRDFEQWANQKKT